MAAFFTKVTIPAPDFKVNYKSRLLFMGSCFSDHIGKRMQTCKFSVCHNPFGIIYNPVSISKSILQLIQKENFKEEELSFYNELWYSNSHSTLFSDVKKEECLNKINTSFITASDFIKKTDVLFLTLGTSWAYELIDTKQVVANCHKIPASKFNRYFSSVENTIEHLSEALSELKKLNPAVKIVFTVSPIRHWKDGAIENQRSKAALILAIARLQQDLKDVFYFPAYEIFMDELRDYRFYAEDMLHPSISGMEYIWESFVDTFLSDEAKTILTKVNSILNKLNHRPLHKNTNAYKKFISSLQTEISDFQEGSVILDFSDDLSGLKK